MSGNVIDYGLTDGKRWNKNKKLDQVITTKRGNFGFVRITIPILSFRIFLIFSIGFISALTTMLML